MITIEGWGLENPDPEVFDRWQCVGGWGCESEVCNHTTHDPYETVYVLSGAEGWSLANIGQSNKHTYYTAQRNGERRYYRFELGGKYYDRITRIDVKQLPRKAKQ